MKKTFTCIVCPNGCEIEADISAQDTLAFHGALCKKGEEYVRQELTDPQRTIASSVRVCDGELPLVSVRLNHPIPKKDLIAVMEEIKKVQVQAPVAIGDCIIPNVLSLGSDVIATKNVCKCAKEN